MAAPLEGAEARDPEVLTINVKNIDDGNPGPRREVRSPSKIEEVCCKYAYA
jgi:hypothetical protein